MDRRGDHESVIAGGCYGNRCQRASQPLAAARRERQWQTCVQSLPSDAKLDRAPRQEFCDRMREAATAATGWWSAQVCYRRCVVTFARTAHPPPAITWHLYRVDQPTGSVRLGMDVGTSEDGAFWLAFLRSLTARGLSGVELVTSDAHQLKNAIACGFAGASWRAAPTSWPTCSPESAPNLAWPPWSAPSTSNCLPPRSTAN